MPRALRNRRQQRTRRPQHAQRRHRARRQQTPLIRDRNSLRPIARTQLRQRPLHVCFRRRQRHEQLARNLVIRPTAGRQRENLELTRTKRLTRQHGHRRRHRAPRTPVGWRRPPSSRSGIGGGASDRSGPKEATARPSGGLTAPRRPSGRAGVSGALTPSSTARAEPDASSPGAHPRRLRPKRHLNSSSPALP